MFKGGDKLIDYKVKPHMLEKVHGAVYSSLASTLFGGSNCR
jgi:hypothetical protein